MAGIDRTPVKTVSQDSLRQAIERRAKFTLIEVLEPANYRKYHIPGAINIPLDDLFEETVQATVSDKARKIVVYCTERSCDASARAARKLLALGYVNVRDFAGGKKAWREAAGEAA